MVRWCCELLSDGKCNMRLVRLLSGLALESNRFRGRTTPILLSMSWRAKGAVSCNLSPHDSDAKCLSVCHGHPQKVPPTLIPGQFNYTRRRSADGVGFKVIGGGTFPTFQRSRA